MFIPFLGHFVDPCYPPSLRDDPKGGEEAMVWWIVEGYPEGIQFSNFPATNWIPWSPRHLSVPPQLSFPLRLYIFNRKDVVG